MKGIPCTGPCSNLFDGLTERSLNEQARLMPLPSSSLSITFDEIRPPLLPTVDNAHTHALNYIFTQHKCNFITNINAYLFF